MRKRKKVERVTLSVYWERAQHKAFQRWARKERRSACAQAVEVLSRAMAEAGVAAAGTAGTQGAAGTDGA